MASQSSSRSPWGKLAVVGVIVAIATWAATPLREKITLGLDLQGGTHMVLQVDLDEAVRSTGERALEGMRRALQEKAIAFTGAVQESIGTLVISGIAPDQRGAAEEALAAFEGTWETVPQADGLRLSMRSGAMAEIRDGAARQVRDTIGRRINEFGVREPSITTSGDRQERIVVQLPGLDDVERVKRIITKSSVMEFRLGRADAASREELTSVLGGTVPDSVELFPGAQNGKQSNRWFALDKVSVVRGEDLDDARAVQDEFSRPAIGFTLGADAGRTFGEFTGQHVNEPLAIVLDGQVVQYARIESQIFSRGQITGGFSPQEAADAALTLRSGALPAKVSIEFEQTVGPSLGKDSIDAGIRATLIGFVAVMLFMIVWYKGAGINAIVALLLNLLFILGMLSLLDATLTLPGVAGIVLTIGMAVDANVIIFERIKEELAAGKAARAAMEAGFTKAFTSIFDSNLTTVIAAFFLYNFGTGPIKGFAVTLTLGLASSMFTAVYVSRAMFELYFHLRPAARTLSIEWRPFRAPSIPFMKLGPLMSGLSVLAVLISIALWGMVGLKKSIDFSGGTQVVVKGLPGTSADHLREKLAGSAFERVTIQQFGDETKHEFLLRLADAEAAVATTSVNAPESTDRREGAATELITTLVAGETAGKSIDVNLAGRRALQESLQSGASLPGPAAEAAAEAIVQARTERGGLVESVEAVTTLPAVPPAAADWLRANASASPLVAISSESVGPAVGAELARQALHAIIWSLLGILAYMSFRFELRFGVAAIAAVAHDVVVTVGVLILLGEEFDLNVIAALLTLVGYSLNDTIVMFDRVRENLKTMPGQPLTRILDVSVNQTLSRTILTATTVFFAVVALLVAGGAVLHGFALAMTVGVIAGTYSTIFVASPIVLLWERARRRRLVGETRVA